MVVMKQLKVLGIDFSLNGTGLSVFNGKELVFKKVFTTTQKDEKLNPDIFIYVPKMEDTMTKIDIVSDIIVGCTEYDFVCMEDHIGRYYNWMDGYGVIKHLLRKLQKPHLMASPTTIKKYAGNGKADKNMMSHYLIRDYNFDLDYIGKLANNIVDASWMAILGYKFYKIHIEKDKKICDTPARTKILKSLADKNKLLINKVLEG